LLSPPNSETSSTSNLQQSETKSKGQISEEREARAELVAELEPFVTSDAEGTGETSAPIGERGAAGAAAEQAVNALPHTDGTADAIAMPNALPSPEDMRTETADAIDKPEALPLPKETRTDDAAREDAGRLVTQEEAAGQDTAGQEDTDAAARDAKPNAKSRRIETRKKNEFIRGLAAAMTTDTPIKMKRDPLKPIADQLAAEVRRYGRVRPDTADALYNAAWENSVVVKEEYYNEFKDLKEAIRGTPLTLDAANRKGSVYRNLRSDYFGSLPLRNSGGLPVDVRYLELSEQYPGIFPADITNPLDQLQRLGEFVKSVRRTSSELDAYYGEYADEMKAEARAGFDAAVAKFEGDIETVARYDADREARAEAKAHREAAMRLQGEALRDDTEAINAAYTEAAKYEREAEKLVAKTVLTKDDKNYIDALMKGERDIDDEVPRKLNAGNIRKVYEAKSKVRDVMAPVKALDAANRQARSDRAAALLEGSENWNDRKIGILLSTETMERNIRDMVGDKTPEARAAAKRLEDELIAPVHTHEAEATRFKNKIVKEIKALGLNKQESVYVQIAGELQGAKAAQKMGLKRSDAELEVLEKLRAEFLAQNKDKIDAAKVEKALPVFKKTYDMLIKRINEAYIQYGYKPMAYRQGYFPHMGEVSDATLARIARGLGFEIKGDTLPTDIAGLTATFRPGRKWNPNALERTGFTTEYDALKGLDNYLNVAGDVIFHTGDIQNLRAFEDAIRAKYGGKGMAEKIAAIRNSEELSEEGKQEEIERLFGKGVGHLSGIAQEVAEYTNLLAGKKSGADRQTEKDLGRGVYGVMTALEGRVAANMVGVNPASALTNIIPLVQVQAEVSVGSMLKAGYETVRSAIKNDGFVAENTFLTNQRGTDKLSRTNLQKASDAANVLFELIDDFSKEWVARAKFNEGLKNGMTRQAAMEYSSRETAGIAADRSKGAVPTYFMRKNPVAKLTNMFQLEVNNQLRHMFKDMPRAAKEKGVGLLVKMLLKYFIGAYLFNDLFENLTGRRPALDILGIANETIGDFTGKQMPNLYDVPGRIAEAGELTGRGFFDAEDQKKSASGAVLGLGANLAEELPFVGGLLGGGRIPISGALPDVGGMISTGAGMISGEIAPERGWHDLRTEGAKPLYYLLPPFGGGQVKKVVEGAQTLAAGGSYTYDNEGNRKQRYAAEDPNALETAQALIFGPSALPGARDWINGGFATQSARYTAGYDAAMEAGMSGDEYREWWETGQNMEALLDAEGESITGSKRAQLMEYVLGTDLTQAQKRLLIMTGDPAADSFAEDLGLDEKQIAAYGAELGRERYKMMDALFNSAVYRSMDAGNRAAAVSKLYQLANASARAKTDENYEVPDAVGKMYEAYSVGVDPVLYLEVQGYAKAYAETYGSGSGSITQEAMIAVLDYGNTAQVQNRQCCGKIET
jgi:hypothetical protein